MKWSGTSEKSLSHSTLIFSYLKREISQQKERKINRLKYDRSTVQHKRNKEKANERSKEESTKIEKLLTFIEQKLFSRSRVLSKFTTKKCCVKFSKIHQIEKYC